MSMDPSLVSDEDLILGNVNIEERIKELKEAGVDVSRFAKKKLAEIEKKKLMEKYNKLTYQDAINFLQHIDKLNNGEKIGKISRSETVAYIIKGLPLHYSIVMLEPYLKQEDIEMLTDITVKEIKVKFDHPELFEKIRNELRENKIVLKKLATSRFYKLNKELGRGNEMLLIQEIDRYVKENQTGEYKELQTIVENEELDILGNESETNSSIEEMSSKGKKKKSSLETIAEEVLKGTAAGAAPGVLTGNPEGAAVGSIIGAIGGAAIGVGSVISDALSSESGDAAQVADANDIQQSTEIIQEQVALSSDQVQDALEKVKKISSDKAEAEDNLDNMLDNINVELPDLQPIDMEIVEEEVSAPISTSNRGKRPGYYKKPIHEDALGLFFGSSVNPNWNNALFFDRSQVLTEGDIEGNKKYYYDQSISIVNKYGVDILVPSLKYGKDASWKDIIKENHEILQLYFKLKGIEPVKPKPVPEMIKSLVDSNKKEDTFQESANIEDYQSGHDTKIENDKYNPFRVVGSELKVDPKDAYDMRLLGNAIPIEERKTFRGDPQVLNNIVVRDLKKSSIKGQLPVTKNMNTVVPIVGTTLRLADENEMCSNLFKFNY